MTGRAGWRAVPALALGLGAAGLLGTSSVHLPGHQGAARVAPGFVPGRWDARFIVARGPAALSLPAQPLRARLRLSGPASLDVRTAEGGRAFELTAEPRPVEIVLPRGGHAELVGQGTVRLHDVVLTRLGPPPWARLALMLAVTLAVAAFAVLVPRRWAAPASAAAVAAVAALLLRDGLPGLALTVGMRRLGPAVTLLALAVLFLAPRLLPATAKRLPPAVVGLPVAFGLIALASCLAQVVLLPQPLLIGDPAAYHDIGRRFAAALLELRGPRDVADAAQDLRPYGGLAFLGVLYGTLLAVRDNVTTLYVAHAVALAGAVALLVRAAARLGGRALAVVAGTLAVLYPTFPVICGIVQPEPVILLLWCLSLHLLLRARDAGDLRRFAWAGTAFAVGLALHPQGIWFLLGALGAIALVFARPLTRRPVRAWAGAFLLGVVPVATATAAGEAWARPAAQVLDERHGFWAYTARVPLGFWLFLDSDGWQGPLRIDETRFARGLRAAEAAGSARGTAGRAGYTLRFVAENPAASTRAVLRNLHRLWSVPDNPFRRDWILPYGLQLRWHRVLVVLFLLAVPLALARRGVPLLVPVVMLAATYPLYHVFNKYAVPATPFLLLGAALALERLALAEPRVGAFAVAGLAAGLGTMFDPGDLVLRGLPLAVARGAPPVLWWGGMAVLFALSLRCWAADRAGRVAAALAGTLFLASSAAATWEDPSARELKVALDREARHEIVLGPEGMARLATSPEAWLFLDLRLPDGRGERLRLLFDGGTVQGGGALRPTMPTFGLATVRGGRDPRTFRQWWAVAFEPGMLREGRIALRAHDPSGAARLFGDIGTSTGPGTDRGLSLGQWPWLSVYRLMHDGEYRLPAAQPLQGERRSEVAGRPLPGALGIRLVILDRAAGPPPWVSGNPAERWTPAAVY